MPVALVTGAGVRVGAAIARAFDAAGYELILHANRSTASAEALAKTMRRARVEQADLSDPAAVDALAARVSGPLDALVHNAGLFETTPYEQVTRAAWRRMLAVTLEAPYFLTQALLPALRAAPAPCVVHITDVLATRPALRHSHYCIAKAGLDMATRALAAELGPKVRVNAVAPGVVAWPDGFDAEQKKLIVSRIPAGRIGSPEDVAGAVLWLVRDAAYVTGQTIPVDGGRTARL